jgi:hypothetical protein
MKEENKIYSKQQYKCAICGEIYDAVQERMNCEMKCIKKQKEEVKKAAEEKKKAEQTARKQEVEKALEHAIELLNAYTNDYGYYEHSDEKISGFDYFWPSRLWHYFL